MPKITPIPYIKWRDGRPRFTPGPRERAMGFRSKDLRHLDGAWFTQHEARMFALLQLTEIKERRRRERRRSAVRLEPTVEPDAAAPERIEGRVYFLLNGERIELDFSGTLRRCGE